MNIYKCDQDVSKYLLYVIFLSIIVETSEICSANNNYFWKESKGKCVRCRGCKIGKWRNYTEEYTGPTGVHGDEDCLLCVPLPPGHYIDLNNKNENGVPQLKQCLVDCKYQNRHLKTPCSPTSDAQCGACLKGYYVAHENIDFPCSEIVTYRPNPKFPTQQNIITTTTPPLAITKKPKDKTDDDDGSGGGDSNLTARLVSLVLGSVTIVSVVMVLIYKKKQRKKGNSLLFDEEESSDDSASIDSRSSASYPQIATAPQEETKEIHDDKQVETDGPEPYCRPGPTETSIAPTSLHMCSCFTQVDCHCDEIFTHPSFQDCLVSRDIFTLTARLICHDHIPFFKKIGISSSTYYQLNVKSDDFKDMCYDNLKQWGEEKGENATLKVYIEGLCHGKFCNIIKEVSKQYLTQNNQNQSGGNDN